MKISKIKQIVLKIQNKIFVVIKQVVIKNNVVEPITQLLHIKDVKIL